jgi:hypothetical protein
MEVPLIIALLGCIALSVFKYYESKICVICHKQGKKVISFLVGATIITIFVELLDDVYLSVHSTNNLLILFLPFAFMILMLVERHIYRHRSKELMHKELKKMIKVLSFSSGFMIGLISVYDLKTTITTQIIFILFLLAFDFIRELSIHMIEGEHKVRTIPQKIKKVFYALSPVYGFTLAYFVAMPPYLKTSILSLFAGSMIYVLVKEVVVTREEKIQPPQFVAGALVMVAIFLVNSLA